MEIYILSLGDHILKAKRRTEVDHEFMHAHIFIKVRDNYFSSLCIAQVIIQQNIRVYLITVQYC